MHWAMPRKAYQLDSNRPALIDTLGWLLVQNKQSERGIELLQSAVKHEANDAEFRYHLAAAYEQAGRLDEARREIRIALENREIPVGPGAGARIVAPLKQLANGSQ